MKGKKLLSAVLMLLAATLMLAAIPTEAEAAIYEDTVRLHIRATSDLEEDQAIKIKVRDLVLEKYAEEFSENESQESVLKRLGELTYNIESDVESWLGELGADYGATVYVDKEWFDTRDYGEFTLPAGYYDALIIELGTGEGQNWWCVMFPPMCLDVATSDVCYTNEEKSLISVGGYNVKFKLLELVSETVANLKENG